MDDRALTAKKLGRYDITRVLGKGAMGVVYEARDPNLNRKVAIKTVRVDSLSKDDAADYEQRFRTEAHSAARLQHPNIVSVYDADRDGDTPFLVMEFVQGEDLKHYLDIGQRYTLEQSVRMVRDLLAALEYAHQNKILHRDIKPANLLIEASGRVKLTDFGVARIQDSGEATRTQGGMVGTLKYMSPEQVEGKTVGAESDLFSAGIVLYQLLTDRRPFDGDSYFSIVNQITNQNPPAPSSINTLLPTAVDAVMARALAKDKTQRFASAQEFSAALHAAALSADPAIIPSANPHKSADPRSNNALERSGSTASNILNNSGSTVTQELELVYWKDVKDSDDPEDLEGFIRRFPEGVYADLAKRRLKRISEGMTLSGQSPYDSTFIAPKPTPAEAVAPTPPAIGAPETPAAAAANTLPSSNFLLDDDATFPGIVAPKAGAAAPTAAFEPLPDSLDLSPEPTFPQGFTKDDFLPPAPASSALPPLADPDTTVIMAPKAKKSPEKSSLESMSFKDALQGNAPKAAVAPLPPSPPPAAAKKPVAAPSTATAPATTPANTEAAPTDASASRGKTGLLVGIAAAVMAVVAAWAWLGGSSKTDPSGTVASAPSISASAALPGNATTATDTPSPAAMVPALPTQDSSNAAVNAPPAQVNAAAESALARAAPEVPVSGTPIPINPAVSSTTVSASATVSAQLSAKAKAKAAAAAASAQAQRDAASPRSSVSGTFTTSRPTPTASPPSSGSVQGANDSAQSPQGNAGAAAPKPAPAEPVKETAPSSPAEVCKDRVLFGYASCMNEQCGKSSFAKHPLCVERREQDERRKAAEQLR
jgi:eukaryotic-like serine/threonine-protein kinase